MGYDELSTGYPEGTDVRLLTREQLLSEASVLAREYLQTDDVEEAFRRIDAGALAGTQIEAELNTLRFLLDQATASSRLP